MLALGAALAQVSIGSVCNYRGVVQFGRPSFPKDSKRVRLAEYLSAWQVSRPSFPLTFYSHTLTRSQIQACPVGDI